MGVAICTKCQKLIASVSRCRLQGRIGYYWPDADGFPFIQRLTSTGRLYSSTNRPWICSSVQRQFSNWKDLKKINKEVGYSRVC